MHTVTMLLTIYREDNVHVRRLSVLQVLAGTSAAMRLTGVVILLSPPNKPFNWSLPC